MATKAPKVKTVINIEACDCRWPIGDPRDADFHFCGAQQVIGKPYCKEHLARSFDAAKSRPKSASSPMSHLIIRAA